MHIETIIKDTSCHKKKVDIKKFFQFIILKDISKKKREVIIYNAIVLNAEPFDATFNISYMYNYKPIISTTSDCSDFFQKEKIIKQFWGEKSEFTNEITTTIQKLTNSKPESLKKPSDYLNDVNNSCKGIFYVEQEEKSNVGKYIIKPIKTIQNESGIILEDTKFENIPPSEIKEFASRGYWFKSKFIVPIDDEKYIDFTASIKLEEAEYISPDFKIYLQTDEKYELKKTNVELLYSKDNIDQTNCEMVKVFSQSKMSYFDEWVKLGIYSSSLFRTKMNSVSEENSYTKGLTNITVKATLENTQHFILRELKLIIFSLFLSLFISIGFDITRQGTPEFQQLFPPSLDGFTLDTKWLFLCVLLFIKYMYIRNTNVKPLISFILYTPLTIWFFLYITYPIIYIEHPSLRNLYLWDIVFSIVSILFYVIVIMRRRHNYSSNKQDDGNKFFQLIGV
ncbi:MULTISPECIES: hypothetical protein [Providencia]|uniref:hypothetical protein n=1 Tax=Providencia TaxID=586 RepID=UPI00226EEE76|nr:hypothetical protein [Providencia rettgeri]MCX9095252.1 hypothetical protein [Providencia rettgeri]